MICIVDYGAGNLKSIENMFKKVGANAIISKDPNEILNADKLVLPGVGHFDHGMKMLRASNLIELLNQKALEEKVPVMGICLGSQLLGMSSEEGNEQGLGWIPMKSVRFDHSKLSNQYKIPHMGWNTVHFNQENFLFEGMENPSRFYFAHSFYLEPAAPEFTLATTDYGLKFSSGVVNENIVGLQFHPEKSHKYGIQIFRNFSKSTK